MDKNIHREIAITYLTSIKEAAVHRQESGYTVCMTDAGRGGGELLKHGWYFADRIIYTDINLLKWDMRIPSAGRGKFRYEVMEHWDTDEIYHIASGFFQNDCRFAIDRDKADEKLKNRILLQQICQWLMNGYMATGCFAGNELAGFNLWRMRERKGRIVLGAVQKKYQHTGMAVYLYGHTIRTMKEKGADTLADRISTGNLASLNLHTRIAQTAGIRFTGVEDWYVKNWN